MLSQKGVLIYDNKEDTLKVVDSRSSSNNESTVADYLWCPLEVLPEESWKKIIDDEGEPLKFQK